MSYSTISRSAYDQAFLMRMTSCVGQEGRQNPEALVAQIKWGVCSKSDIEAAYASALAAENPNPGGDESVITDGMILAAVQQELSELPPE